MTAGDSVNILYLLKVLDTTKISELVTAIDAPPIDVNLALWAAEKAGDVEIDFKKDRIKPLKKAVPSHYPELEQKLMRVIRHYCDKQENITRGRLNGWVQDPVTHQGYSLHEYFMTLQWLIDNGRVIEQKVKIPKAGNREYKEFDFLGLPGLDNEAWNKAATKKWLAEFGKVK